MKYVFQFSFVFDDDRQSSYAFMLDASAIAALGIHDFSGTSDDETLVEGFNSYEASPSTAKTIVEQWRAAFIDKVRAGTAQPKSGDPVQSVAVANTLATSECGVSMVVVQHGTDLSPPGFDSCALSATQLAALVETAIARASPPRTSLKP